jgi:hypothetical protein
VVVLRQLLVVLPRTVAAASWAPLCTSLGSGLALLDDGLPGLLGGRLDRLDGLLGGITQVLCDLAGDLLGDWSHLLLGHLPGRGHQWPHA